VREETAAQVTESRLARCFPNPCAILLSSIGRATHPDIKLLALSGFKLDEGICCERCLTNRVRVAREGIQGFNNLISGTVPSATARNNNASTPRRNAAARRDVKALLESEWRLR
jgi:hypothetical protein